MKIAFISFRIAGTDGVSLEAERWREILKSMGHRVTFIAGELDRPGILIPELHFNHPKVHRVHEEIVTNGNSCEKLEDKIFEMAGQVEGKLRRIIRKEKFDRLIVANVFSLPIHFSLAIAIDRLITEYKIPTVSRNHDFWWERERYKKSRCFELFKRFFPPASPYITHTVINSIAQKKLEQKTGIYAQIIPDTFNFNNTLGRADSYSKNWRKDFGIKKDDIVFLQATRIVPRKQIELSIEFVSKLKLPKAVLVLAGYYGDESGDYLKKLQGLVEQTKINAKFIGARVSSRRAINHDGKRIYTLWDCFVNCDFVTYPSKVEGFGNQFIEAVYFKKPILVNRYEVYKKDIEPLGFETIDVNGKITEKSIKKAKSWLSNPQKTKQITEKNFKIARKHFSYEATAVKLKKLGL